MDIESLFAEEGLLATELKEYRPRQGQIKMAQTVEKMLIDGGCAVLEAGTGIGKTFAYLVPIIQSGQTALISTAAKALQDQLSQRDIPLLLKILKRSLHVAVLKGRSNYLCRLALEDKQGYQAADREGQEQWQKILQFATYTSDGDIRGATDISPDSPIWASATSTQDSCQRQACSHYDSCFLYQARTQAQRADIVIVNHHLLLSDMRLKNEGVAEILPTREIILFDEAHCLPQLAPQYFGEQLSTTRLLRSAADARRLAERHSADAAAIIATATQLRDRVGILQEITAHFRQTRLAAVATRQADDWRQATTQLYSALIDLTRVLMARASDNHHIENLASRVAGDSLLLNRWMNEDEAEATEAETEAETEPLVRWLEYEQTRVTFHLAPITGRTLFAKQWEKTQTVLFTSATLSIAGNFVDFCEAIGLDVETATTHCWDSPYDFANQSLLYLPRHLPPPNDDAHTAAVVEAALPLIRINEGRAFLLFSSHRALTQGTAILREALAGESFEILKQGEAPNDELLNIFRSDNNQKQVQKRILVGSQSFWQGIDVKGAALSLVIVDKIPFTPPNDPLLVARDDWRKQRGDNPFWRNQIPPAVILMKQVAGRLIRDYDDYGIFMVGDTRLSQRHYGKTILKALPPMKRCDDEQQAIAFLQTRMVAPA